MNSERIRKPFEVYHPSVFIVEEMSARGWDRDRLATEMVGLDDLHHWGVTRLSLDMYFDVGPLEPTMTMGDTVDLFARAFGCSAQLFTNLRLVLESKGWHLPWGLPAGAGDDEETATCGGCGARSAQWSSRERPPADLCVWSWEYSSQMWVFDCAEQREPPIDELRERRDGTPPSIETRATETGVALEVDLGKSPRTKGRSR